MKEKARVHKKENLTCDWGVRIKMGLGMPFGWYIRHRSLEEHIYERYSLELLTGCGPDSPMKGPRTQ